MFLHRDAVSSYALDRSIRARLLITHPIDCRCVTQAVPIVPRSIAEDGRNWEIDTDALPAGCAVDILHACAEAGERLNLKTQRYS